LCVQRKDVWDGEVEDLHRKDKSIFIIHTLKKTDKRKVSRRSWQGVTWSYVVILVYGKSGKENQVAGNRGTSTDWDEKGRVKENQGTSRPIKGPNLPFTQVERDEIDNTERTR